ncbi:class I tRNA ligase family protein [Candidatus Wolfebacteria bacterium]|nr:class I tRNA ligase family protein [Candidatus Wolfebacteria bacterium]
MPDFKFQNPSEREEKILEFWRKNKIFEKSVNQRKNRPVFSFYDGPPFATGLPHYGHILASIIKDAVPRYQTMKGKFVERRWGWDCHGLPIENLIESELNLVTKKDIEKFGVDKFNEAARNSVLRYAGEWKKIIPRIGRWVDMERDYKTMDWQYMESIWWVFKSLFDKGLIYEGNKSMHICPRCETTLANFEVAQGYKDITDISVTAKFELVDPIRTDGSKEPASNGASEPKTYILAWTTTPWTLPGNVALAVGKDMEYVSYSVKNSESGKTETYILERNAFNRMKIEAIAGDTFRGKDLIGKKYKPLFDYYANDNSPVGELKNRENGWKIYGADFVTTDEGTGVVHIAPAFGEDDMNLAKKENLPFIQHVGMDGKFKPEVKDFAGLSVKPKENPQATDIEIIKWLAKENKLFSKEKIIHSYPHCWRCDTPLLNYAASSWFVDINSIKGKLIANNKKINWIPEHIKDGRFGKWLEGARDWAISRSRFWGAPLPVWQCAHANSAPSAKTSGNENAPMRINKKCGAIKVIGSLEELKENIKKSGNQYFAMRHGEAENNVRNIINSKIENNHFSLTNKGEKTAINSAKKLKSKKIDLIFSSDFLRTGQTAEIVAEIIGFDKSKIILDKRLREVNTGVFDNESSDKYHNFCSVKEKFFKTPPEGENLTKLKNRMTEFLYEMEKKYSGKNILIVSHEYPIWLMFSGAAGADVEKSIELRGKKPNFIKTGEVKKIDFIPLPHDSNYELDLHRPYIDDIELRCSCGGKTRRVPEVFDCWLESGSMPYAQIHYPFDPDSISSRSSDNYGAGNKKNSLPKNFPAEFIAEGIDQTRGWFYTLLVLSTALFNKSAYKNVVVNGIILAESGQKMSKRLKNYPDPMEIVKKYGADALRLYLLSSPAVAGESLNFSEKGADEVYKKVILRLWNVYSFYELYADKKILNLKSKILNLNILDKWILARLNQLIAEVSGAMENYELDKAVRPIGDFVDDLSTWYIRRSRDRFKIEGLPAVRQGKDKKDAMATTKFVLTEFSKIIAPFAPFIAETIYQNLGNKNSVHLESFPASNKKMIDKKLLEAMAETRKICSLGLETRQKAQIKVRQPLSELRINPSGIRLGQIKNYELKNKKEFIDLIRDELNVKEIVFDKNIVSDVDLDIKITPELKDEGNLREFTRAIQDLRKKAGLKPDQKIILEIQTDEIGKNFIEKFENEFKKSVGAEKIKFIDLIDGEEIKIDELEFKIEVKKYI